MSERKLLTPAELAARWSLPPGTLRSMVSRGQLDGVVVRLSGRVWRADPDAVAAYEARQIARGGRP